MEKNLVRSAEEGDVRVFDFGVDEGGNCDQSSTGKDTFQQRNKHELSTIRLSACRATQRVLIPLKVSLYF